MPGIPLRIAEPTGRYRRDLRRFTWRDGQECGGAKWGHNAVATIGEVDEAARERTHGDNWPHEDPRWPASCGACGYEFTPSDQWQRNDNAIYRLPDGTEFAFWGAFGRAAPPGTMVRAAWADGFYTHPDGVQAWVVALPDGGEWVTSQPASGGGHWTVTGTPPQITVSPSVWHNQPHGWHGWVRDGYLMDA